MARPLGDLWPDPDRRDAALMRCLVRVATAEGELPPERPRREPGQLTDKERWFLSAAAAGLTWRMTADLYGCEPGNVTDGLRRARRVLAAKNTTHAVAIALRRGLIR